VMPRTVLPFLTALGLAAPEPAWTQGTGRAPRVSEQEYEGWRQYSVHCARCHGQDVLGNPVTADLLKSVGPGGPVAEPQAFAQVVKAGRPDRGMPGLANLLTDEQVAAIYAYVKGRADGRISAGRPVRGGG
jgi:mono/diheme cytochrome c family protein